MSTNPPRDDDELGVRAFSDEAGLSDYFGVAQGEGTLRVEIVIYSSSLNAETTDIIEIGPGWTWRDYYRQVRDFRNAQFGGANTLSPYGTTILARVPDE